MKNTACRSILLAVGILCLTLVAPLKGESAIYETDLTFATSDQSMWGGGEAVILEDTYPAGLPWNESLPRVGVDIGVASAWVQASTDGYIGLEAGYSIDSGSINASYPVSVDLIYPDPSTVSPGETFTISSQYVVDSSAGFDTNFPEIQAYVDLIFDVYAVIDAYCTGLGSDSWKLIDVNYTQEIIGFNRDGDGQLSILGEDTGLIGEPIPVSDYVDITLTIPDIETTSTMTSPDTYKSDGETDFLALGIDVDKVATSIISTAVFGYPDAISLDGSLLFGLVDYDILDITAGAQLDILQSFIFEPELMISLETSLGDEYTFRAGDSIDLVMGESPLDFTPTYTLSNTFTNLTDLSIVPTLWLKVLEAAIGVDINLPWPIPDLHWNESWTLYEDTFEIAGLPTIPVYHDDFSLAFSEFTTASFQVVPGAPVPEPATILLIGTGLIGLGIFRRKLRK